MFALDSRINDEESKKNLEANKKKTIRVSVILFFSENS